MRGSGNRCWQFAGQGNVWWRAKPASTALLGQPSQSQALCKFGEMFRPADWDQFAQVGNAKGGIELTQNRHCSLGFREVSCERFAGREDAVRSRIVWLFVQSPLRPCGRIVVTISEEMRESRPHLHVINSRIERAQAHGACMVLDSQS